MDWESKIVSLQSVSVPTQAKSFSKIKDFIQDIEGYRYIKDDALSSLVERQVVFICSEVGWCYCQLSMNQNGEAVN